MCLNVKILLKFYKPFGMPLILCKSTSSNNGVPLIVMRCENEPD